MNILLTNDDGIYSDGLKTIEKDLKKNSDIKMYIVAPDAEKSGTSHSVSLFKPIFYEKVEKNKYSLSGYPVDCVIAGIKGFFKDIKFDAIISGINRGPNLGTDIFYSGTFSAGMKGAEEGIPSFSFSINKYTEPYGFEKIGDFLNIIFIKLYENLNLILEKGYNFMLNSISSFIEDKNFFKNLDLSVVFNINFPDLTYFEEIKGIKPAYLSKRDYKDYVLFEEKKGEKFIVIEGDYPVRCFTEFTDAYYVHNGFVSITPVFYPAYGTPFIRPEVLEGIF